ncbi:MAG: VapC toxin family PIN domain ribonuclease [Desulfobacterales bacterium CG23_combo_of_CG06-09_8_20_14_all_51_8]|nr:MAG: VapC toxin family PIN domain ribonuclease [Desulfobacterales bacterium CG23_combo_of_CG06-09_8_20_14_all_51_8]
MRFRYGDRRSAMILYLDTSALIKRYFQEIFSEAVSSRWMQSEAVVTSAVAYAETIATIFRKKNKSDLSDMAVENIVSAFKRDWSAFIQVEVTNDLNDYIDRVVQKHSLRGFDAIHLASALVIHEKLPLHFFFACFDQKLNHAARIEGLASF